MKYLSLFLLLFSCCTAPDKPDPSVEQRFAPELRLVYNQFLEDADRHDANPLFAPMLKIMIFVDEFDPSDIVTENQIAFCGRRTNDGGKTHYLEIQVLKRAWHEALLYNTPFENRAIAYHELGHCLFGLDHSKVEMSIMYKSIYGNEDYWRENWNKKVDQFFEYIKNGDPEAVQIRID